MTGSYCPWGVRPATRSVVLARRGMAATSQPLATQTALRLLQAGGSAVDAAIGANAVLGLVEPTSCGIGGDLFALVWEGAARRLHGLNASGRAPRALTIDVCRAQRLTAIPPHGPLPVSVPGCVAGWAELHARFGRLPWSDVLAPAIAYAREGFPVTEVIARDWEHGGRILGALPGFAETFLPKGRAPRCGEIFTNPGLADTLATVATAGSAAFYRGELAARLGTFCARVGAYLGTHDLATHTSTWVNPLTTTFRGCEVWALPPNGQGFAVLQMLNLLEPYPLGKLGHNSSAYLHLLIEAKKIAYEDRARYYADPDFVRVPWERLISKGYAEERRKLLGERASRALPPGEIAVTAADARLRDSDTAYLATADDAGNMVSLIQSNYRGFGSGLCPDGMGFCLQNRGELFALDERHPNVLAPGKRPFHTIIPGFVTRHGEAWLCFGVMGGDMQPQGQVQILCNLLEHGMDLQAAGDSARCHHSGSSTPTGETMTDGGSVALEAGVAAPVRHELEGRGHVLVERPGVFGGYQAILRDAVTGVLHGATESRKDGQAAGY